MDIQLCDRCESKIEQGSGMSIQAGGGVMGLGGKSMILCQSCRADFKKFMKGK